MNMLVKLGLKNKESKQELFAYDPKSCEILRIGYWFALFISGICFTWALNYLNWLTGIGCFCISNLLSVFAVRAELLARNAFALLSEKKKTYLNTKRISIKSQQC